ncbi:MAG: hypothetical protein JO222_00080, partial [Frankiales bacterium]|nr:hypothetical protein [Frankiales bacterium]
MTTATIARFPADRARVAPVAAASPAGRASAGSALRLTRRGRLAVVLFALVSAVLGFSLLGSSQAA